MIHKVTIAIIILFIGTVGISGCTTIPNQNKQTQQWGTVCIYVECTPKPNDPGKPLCTGRELHDFTGAPCIPIAPIVGTWEGYGTTQPMSYATFEFTNSHMLEMKGLPIVGSATANWYRCHDDLDCLNQGLDNSNYIILGPVFNNMIIHYDGTGNSIDFNGNKLVKQ